MFTRIGEKKIGRKISKIDFIDPYDAKKMEFDYGTSLLSKVSYQDIVNYLLFVPSAFTAEELKCYKSMDAYNYYVSGLVKEIGVKHFGYGKGMSF